MQRKISKYVDWLMSSDVTVQNAAAFGMPASGWTLLASIIQPKSLHRPYLRQVRTTDYATVLPRLPGISNDLEVVASWKLVPAMKVGLTDRVTGVS